MSNNATLPQQRNETIDVVRGVALLGILVMNIQTFSMPFGAYSNPNVWGNLEGLNYLIWYMGAMLADQKFMTIFSMLFGAGLILLVERLQATGRPAISIHYRRMIWLLVFGLVHAYCIWYGDILVSYAICGMWIVWLRKVPAIFQLLIGLVLVAVVSVLMGGLGALLLMMPAEESAKLLAQGIGAFGDTTDEVAAFRGSWSEQFSYRTPLALMMQTELLFFYSFWRVSGLMLIGMALYRWGVFTGRCRTSVYAILLALGILIGIPLVWAGIELRWAYDWEQIRSEFLFFQFNYWGSIPVALGWVALVVLFVRSGMLGWFRHALACVGRMALSNYLLQSIVCTLIFYGHGLGAFGSLERTEQFLVVLGVSLAQLIWSPLWLRLFQFGPFEWLWRTLTYLSIQPMRRRPPVVPEG